MYPVLLLLDNCLNNILWLNNTHYHYFNNVILLILSLNFLIADRTSQSLYSILILWVGLLSTELLIMSIVYYCITLSNDLETDEPPTLEDIFNLIDAITHKLHILKEESIVSKLQIDSKLSIIIIVGVTSIIQWALMSCIAVKRYVISYLIFCSIYHSDWVQATLRLLWRSGYIRNVIHLVDRFKKKRPIKSLKDLISIQEIKSNESRLKVSDLEIMESYMDIIHLEQTDSVKVLELTIWENQRKWNGKGWFTKLFSYERGPFSIFDAGQTVLDCKAPLKFEDGLFDGWTWLDKKWEINDWVYFDSCWNLVGSKDSLQCYTRSRKWVRRILQLESNNESKKNV